MEEKNKESFNNDPYKELYDLLENGIDRPRTPIPEGVDFSNMPGIPRRIILHKECTAYQWDTFNGKHIGYTIFKDGRIFHINGRKKGWNNWAPKWCIYINSDLEKEETYTPNGRI